MKSITIPNKLIAVIVALVSGSIAGLVAIATGIGLTTVQRSPAIGVVALLLLMLLLITIDATFFQDRQDDRFVE